MKELTITISHELLKNAESINRLYDKPNKCNAAKIQFATRILKLLKDN